MFPIYFPLVDISDHWGNTIILISYPSSECSKWHWYITIEKEYPLRVYRVPLGQHNIFFSLLWIFNIYLVFIPSNNLLMAMDVPLDDMINVLLVFWCFTLNTMTPFISCMVFFQKQHLEKLSLIIFFFLTSYPLPVFVIAPWISPKKSKVLPVGVSRCPLGWNNKFFSFLWISNVYLMKKSRHPPLLAVAAPWDETMN